MKTQLRPLVVAFVVGILSIVPASGQRGRGRGAPDPATLPASIDVRPAELSLEIGGAAQLEATVSNDAGEAVSAPVLFLTPNRRSLGVTQEGMVEALAPGDFVVIARVPRPDGPPLSVSVPVSVAWPSVDRVEIDGVPERLWAGSLVEADIRVVDVTGARRTNVPLVFESGDSEVLRVDRFGIVQAVAPGATMLRVTADGVSGEVAVTVDPDPAVSLVIEPAAVEARTGDVVRFRTVARDSGGQDLDEVSVYFTVQALTNPGDPASPAAAQIAPDGRFVAERPGRYTVVAVGPSRAATATVDVAPRGVARRLEVVGRAPVRDRHSSDLWVWEGLDGRDYAVTGTWGSDGSAYFWDVTDPAEIRRIDTVRVDARTVNDVKVSPDGRLAIISREGASNRQNGIILLDVTDPSNVVEITSFSEELTGGVHNLFIEGDHVYALSNGRRFDVINIAEPGLPFRVGQFELDTPAHSIHDVWVDDGIAYSSNWEDGVVLVDVGNGVAGGRPDNPVEIARYADPFGNTHAAFPFRSESTGRFYVVTGDETFPTGLDPEGPTVAGGYMHVVDFTDLENPVEVARFEVPEAGSHNLWIEDDVLYAAFYNGGLRIVDLSGELMGDLYRQGREIARFVPKDPDGYVRNEAMVWGAQPHKGTIFLSDWNSGLWAVRFVEEVE